MIHIDYAVIVEGKYDKMRVERVCDAPVFTTEGFRIFSDKRKKDFLIRIAKKSGILILTDSDRAGFMIRNHIRGFIKEGNVLNAYIPEIIGKERRKRVPSKEGKLGVEGMEDKLLEDVLQKFASQSASVEKEKITKADLFDTGLYGGAGSAAARINICEKLSLPKGLSSDSFMEALNMLMSREEFFEMMVDEKCTRVTGKD